MDENELIPIKCYLHEILRDKRLEEYKKEGLIDWVERNKNAPPEYEPMSLECYVEEENNSLYKINYFGDYILVRHLNGKGEVWYFTTKFNKKSAIVFLEGWDSRHPFEEKMSFFETHDFFNAGEEANNKRIEKAKKMFHIVD